MSGLKKALFLLLAMLSFHSVIAKEGQIVKANNTEVSSRWITYYEQSEKHDKPKPTLVKAIDFFKAENISIGHALDLGCGIGKDTAYMLQNGWIVTAVDAEVTAQEFFNKKIPSEKSDQVKFIVSTYEEYPFSEEVNLVNASYALPFCSPSEFDNVMSRITQAISSGGRFAGQFFGLNDTWSKRPNMTFLTKEAILKYFKNSYHIEFFQEKEWDGASASGPKHWHVFDVVAKKI